MAGQDAIPSTLDLTRRFWAHLSVRRKRQLGILMILMVVASFAEVLSLGAVLPFLGVLTSPEKVYEYPAVAPFLSVIGVRSAHELLLPITLLFIAAVLLAGAMRLLLLYANTRLSYAIGADFSYEAYRRTLYQPYSAHVSRNSSEIISGIGKARMIVQVLLMPLLTLISSAWILLAVLGALLVVDPLMTLIAFVGFGAIYGLIILLTRRRLAENSRRVARQSTQVLKAMREGLGGIRDVLIDGSQAEYCRVYRRSDDALRQAQASTIIIGSSPRYAAEALGMVFIAILAYFMMQQPAGVASAITTLGVLALGAQRLLPVLQQSYSAIVSIRGGNASLVDALALLDQPISPLIFGDANASILFSSSVELRDLSFRYSAEGPWVLRGINLLIPKGSSVGFIGATGSGKSTLLDIVMGLLVATEGSVLIDGVPLAAETQRAWQRRIAHVPQSIYLADSSISENIAFGVPKENIDIGRVLHAAKKAQISGYIESLSDGYQTRIGERGVRLSGGQRQRIGIARALYRQAEVMVLDEATSALDTNTEQTVMDTIRGLKEGLTTLIIAHRLSTLEHCDLVVELDAGRVLRTGSYRHIIGR